MPFLSQLQYFDDHVFYFYPAPQYTFWNFIANICLFFVVSAYQPGYDIISDELQKH